MGKKKLRSRYKIQIITFSSGILIALLTTFLAFSFSRQQEALKESRVYYKTLSVLDANLDWHLNQLTRVEKSLELLEKASMIDKQIVINEFPTKFDTKILLNNLDNLTQYNESDELLLKTLIFYLNHIEDLNSQLKFENANQTITTLSDDESIQKGINDYFASIKEEYLDKLKMEITIVKKLIIKEQKIR